MSCVATPGRLQLLELTPAMVASGVPGDRSPPNTGEAASTALLLGGGVPKVSRPTGGTRSRRTEQGVQAR
jgi:hypothetical protein